MSCFHQLGLVMNNDEYLKYLPQDALHISGPIRKFCTNVLGITMQNHVVAYIRDKAKFCSIPAHVMHTMLSNLWFGYFKLYLLRK